MKKRIALLLAAAVAAPLATTGCSARARIASGIEALARDVAAGRAGAADATERRLLALADSTFEPGDAEWTRARDRIARLRGWAGDDERAFAIADATVLATGERSGAEDEALVQPLATTAWLHVYARRWDDARDAAGRIASICRSTVVPAAPGSPCGTLAGLDLGWLLAAAGDPRAASAEYRRRFGESRPVTVREGNATQATTIARWHLEFGDDAAAAWHLQGCGDAGERGTQRQRSEEAIDVDGSGDVILSFADAAHEFDPAAPRCLDDAIELAVRVGRRSEAARLEAIRSDAWAGSPDIEDSLLRDLDVADARGDDPFAAADRAHTLGFYYAGKGRRSAAIRLYEGALQRLARGDHRDGRPAHRAAAVLRVDLLLDLARQREAEAEFAKAEAAYRDAQASASRFLHPSHAWLLDSRAGVARCLAAEHRLDEAEKSWRAYVASCDAVRGPGHADCALGLAGLASVLRSTGREQEAARAERDADAIRGAAARRLEEARERPSPPAPAGPALPLPPPPSPAIQPPPRNASRWNAAERSSNPWPRSPFAETPSTSPARCPRSATPPRTST